MTGAGLAGSAAEAQRPRDARRRGGAEGGGIAVPVAQEDHDLIQAPAWTVGALYERLDRLAAPLAARGSVERSDT